MITLSFAIVAELIWFCQTFFPSNIILRCFRQRDRLKWGALVGLVGAAVYYGLYLLLVDGWDQWGWDAVSILARLGGVFIVISLLKFVLFIPVSVALLVIHRTREAILLWQVRRELRREAKGAGAPAPEFTAKQQQELRTWARQTLANPR